ncbi:hypothetical protein AB9E16_13210 [Rhizobium leguminosarum]|nr:hypothetical protein [Rhizobium leguminosarum]MBY2944187.1 hypothetical protein [Rhizobium leguminosarum]
MLKTSVERDLDGLVDRGFDITQVTRDDLVGFCRGDLQALLHGRRTGCSRVPYPDPEPDAVEVGDKLIAFTLRNSLAARSAGAHRGHGRLQIVGFHFVVYRVP